MQLTFSVEPNICGSHEPAGLFQVLFRWFSAFSKSERLNRRNELQKHDISSVLCLTACHIFGQFEISQHRTETRWRQSIALYFMSFLCGAGWGAGRCDLRNKHETVDLWSHRRGQCSFWTPAGRQVLSINPEIVS